MPNAFIRKLNDKDGNVILPASRAAGIYFDDDSVLQDYVASEGVMNKALGDKNGKDLTSYVTGLSVNGRTVTFTRGDGTSGSIQTQDTNTTYSAFKGATSSAAGGTGLVPAPASGQQARFLRGDGTWQTPPNTTYGNATTSTDGLMSSEDKTKLDGIATGANKYTHPSYTNRASGLYKITVDAQGHVSAATAVTKSDITALGIPAQDTNTTYVAATDDSDGLMSAEDKAKLDGISAGANAYTHPSFTARNSGLYKITVNNQGHVTAATAVAKGDITALGIPAQDTTYTNATTSKDGLMSSEDKTKLDGIATGANKYTHPSYTARTSGLYKITVDASGHVSAVTAVTKSDITNLGIPGSDTNTTYSVFKAASASAAGGSGLVPAPAAGENDEYLRGDGTWATPPNTTYTNATTSKAGLMSSTDKAKLDGIASGANKTTVDTALSTSSTNPVRNSVVTTALNGKASTSHTHSAATTSTAGFMSAADKTLLNSLSNSVVVDTSWGSAVSDIP